MNSNKTIENDNDILNSSRSSSPNWPVRGNESKNLVLCNTSIETQENFMKALVIPVGVKITPSIQSRIDDYYELQKASRTRQGLRILARGSRIKQIRKVIDGWSKAEGPRCRSWRKHALVKLMKPIREPKYGLTLNDLAGAFYQELYIPDDVLTGGSLHAHFKMRKLIKSVEKNHHEGIKLVRVRFRDPMLGTEYRYVNGFWNDEIIELKVKRKEKIIAGYQHRIEKLEENVRLPKEERKRNLELEMGMEKIKINRLQRERQEKFKFEWWRKKYQESKYWTDKFAGKLPYSERLHR